MRILVALCRFEFHYGIRRPGYLALVIICNLLVLYSLYEDQSIAIRATMFFYVFFLFFEIGTVSRDQHSGMNRITDGCPISLGLRMAGRGCGQLLLFFLLGFEIVLLVCLANHYLFDDMFSGSTLFQQYFFNYCLVSVNALCLVWLVETICKNNVFAALLGVCTVVFITIFFEGDHATVFSYMVPPLNFGTNLFAADMPSGLTGIFPKAGMVYWVLAEQGCLSLAFLLLSYFITHYRAYDRCPKWQVLLLTAGFLCGGVASASHLSGIYKSYEAGYQETLQLAKQEQETVEQEQSDVPVISYTMNLELHSVKHLMDCQTVVTMENRGMMLKDKLFFTLMADCHIKQISDMEGQSLSWQQHGDFVEVFLDKAMLPGQTASLKFVYKGVFWKCFTDCDAKPRGMIDFVAPEMVVLRSGNAWYPLGGYHYLYQLEDYQGKGIRRYESRTILSHRYISHPSARFQLCVNADRPMEILTGLPIYREEHAAGSTKTWFISEAAQDIYLLAAPYVYAAGKGNFRVYCAQEHTARAEKILQTICPSFEFYEHIISLKETPPFAIVEMPIFLLDSWENQAAERKRVSLHKAVLVSEAYFRMHPFRENDEITRQQDYVRESLLSLWWPAFATGDDSNICAGLLAYMDVLYQESIYGKKAYFERKNFWLHFELEETIASGSGIDRESNFVGGESMVVQQVFFMLDDIRASSLGEDGLHHLLNALYEKSLSKETRDLNGLDVYEVLQEEEDSLLSQGKNVETVKGVFKSMRERALYLQKLETDKKGVYNKLCK